jgi:hypothetical protein
VLDAAAARYATAAGREDIEVSDEFNREMQLPGASGSCWQGVDIDSLKKGYAYIFSSSHKIACAMSL